MTQHTTEPWKVSLEDSTPEWSVITAAGGRVVANVNEETGPELIAGVPVMRVMPGELNARRIVACVNACRGLPTDELEQKGLVAAVGSELLVLDQNLEDLLTELGEIQRIASGSNMTHNMMVIRNRCADAIAKFKAKGDAT